MRIFKIVLRIITELMLVCRAIARQVKQKSVCVYSQNEKSSTGCSGAAVITVAVWSLAAETVEQSQCAA